MQEERSKRGNALAVLICGLTISSAVFSQVTPAPTFAIKRATGPIKVDADLSDEGWKDAVAIDRWYETNPGNNTEPKVKSVGRLTYDDKYLYASFEFFDPEPENIRGPYAEQDALSTAYDYGGLF